jgi:hypothetical protein
MINKLISKTQVGLLEYDGNPSQDYKDGYCRAINDVLDLEPIPTLGADEYEKFKSDYENRLKADMVAMLTELKKEIEEQSKIPNDNMSAYDWNNGVYACYKVVQQKIDKLKENTDGNKND